jgi:hypothetical protein
VNLVVESQTYFYDFDVHDTVHRDILLYNTNRCTNFSIIFWKETLNVSDSSSVHRQEFFTVHTAMVCHTGLLTYTVTVCTVKTPDDGQRNCPKRVEFTSKII